MSVKAIKSNSLKSFKTWFVKEKEETIILLRSPDTGGGGLRPVYLSGTKADEPAGYHR